MADFTLGPWRIDDEDISPRIIGPMRDDGISPMVAEVRIGLKASDANARLIAAAPDLYEALLSLIPSHRSPFIRCWCPHGYIHHEHTPGCVLARAAIAKAEGRTEV